MKAVVLARGKGTRMQQADAGALADEAQQRMAGAGFKGMIPFRRPFLDYVLSALADATIDDVCLVIGPDPNPIRDYYIHRPPVRVSVTFAVQPEPTGTAHAVLAAQSFAGSDPFIVINSDNYYPVGVLRTLAALDGPGLPAFRRAALVNYGNVDAERVRGFAVLVLAEDGRLLDIIEKPDAATFAQHGDDSFVSMNCWRFDATIFEACRAVERSSRGEFELPEAVRYAVHVMHLRFRTFVVEEGVLDLSRRRDIAEVERRLAHVDPTP